MASITRFKTIKYTVWAISGTFLITGLVLTTDPKIAPISQIYVTVLVQIGGAFFFALTVGWVIDRVRDMEGYTVLWLFSQEFRKAGVLSFFASRGFYAETALEHAFANHRKGEILMVGPSLRLFLAPGQHFYEPIRRVLTRKDLKISVWAVSSCPERNHELPLRSFVEEFNQDGSFPKSEPFDWNKKLSFSFEQFEENFFDKHGLGAASQQRVRVIHDLEATRAGVRELQGIAKGAGNHIHHREFRFAPYCTLIIFPDRAFYTPNLLSSEVPVDMPLIVFHKSSDAYTKLRNHFEFIWWVSEQGKHHV